MNVLGYASHSPTSALGAFRFERREPRADDVDIEILYCGVCHSDIHNVRNDWGGATYPMVPGHEIVGRVLGVGNDVTRFKPGDHVGVEMIRIQEIDEAFGRMLRSDVKYRFVIDLASLKEPGG